MRILVTGAGGLTGGAIVRALQVRGVAVTALVRRVEQAGGDDVQWEIGDCRDIGRLDELLRRCTVLVHVAGIQLATNLVRADALRRIERVVVVSSAGVYSRHRVSAAAYRAAEDTLQSARADAVVLRPTMIYGSVRDHNIHHLIDFALRLHFLPVLADGTALLQPIHYDDVAEATVRLALSKTTGLVDAGGAQALPLRAISATILRALGLPARTPRIPLAPALLVARALDALAGTRWAERFERMNEDRSVDNARLMDLTGLRPRSFEAGVRQQVAELDRLRTGF